MAMVIAGMTMALDGFVARFRIVRQDQAARSGAIESA
jgi:hypothetical protein